MSTLFMREPLAPLLPPSFQQTVTDYRALQDVIRRQNVAIGTFNTLIQARKIQTASADLSAARLEYKKLRNTPARHDCDTAKLCKIYRNAVAEKRQCEEAKETAKADLDRAAADAVARYGSAINRFLEHFNTGFRLGQLSRDYMGGRPRAAYDLIINNPAVSVGDPDTPLDKPAFRNTLSSGDRSALALAFFLALLQSEADLSNTIVVFDDPMTSQDCFRQMCTCQEVCNIRGRAEQVIVLSHEAQFLSRIASMQPSADVRSLQIVKTAAGSAIRPWNMSDSTRTYTIYDKRKLMNYFDDPTSEEAGDVIRSIRPVLEGHLKRRFPCSFVDGEWLGPMIEKVRLSGPKDELAELKPVLGDLEAVNDYTKYAHHGTGHDWNDKLPNPQELEAYVKRASEVMDKF